jgi:hypothetical protein
VNADTPYSRATLDLRAEPVVITTPSLEPGRYFTVQLVDLYTHNFASLGTRTTGNAGGDFLVAGPGWDGKVPPGIADVIRCETEFAQAIGRTQLFDPTDVENVRRIQRGYDVRPLSAHVGRPAPAKAPPIDWPSPLGSADALRGSLRFFDQLAFVLSLCPTHPSEVALRERFASIGIRPGERFDPDALTPEVRQAYANGVADAWSEFADLQRRVAAGQVTSGDAFGTRERLGDGYLLRMAGDVYGIYGNTKEEAIYPAYSVDAERRPLDASTGWYTLRFEPAGLPPVNAFSEGTSRRIRDRRRAGPAEGVV